MLTDNDLYNFTMGQIIWNEFPDIEVRYDFKCRSDIDLCKQIDQDDLLQALEWRQLERLTQEEWDFLFSLDIFDGKYLDSLRTIEKPVPQVSFANGLTIRVEGPWCDSIFWETPILSAVSLLSHETDLEFKIGLERLYKKIEKLKANPQIKFLDFGTRRRFSGFWQYKLVEIVKQQLSADQFIGTSNVKLAMDLNIPCRGTIAHQMYMVLAALMLDPEANSDQLIKSMSFVNDLWYTYYGNYWDQGLLVALPDTYGSEFFLKNFGSWHRWHTWRGFRQDSGDAWIFADLVLDCWKTWNCDAKQKLLSFSDGLDLDTMLRLYDSYGDRTNVSYGWGTGLTNDCGIEPISMVVKPTAVRKPGGQWLDCVKLSDNVAKATGTLAAIKQYKQLSGYIDGYDRKALY